MTYKCTKCSKTATYRENLKCDKCAPSNLSNDSSNFINTIVFIDSLSNDYSSNSSSSDYSGGGGDFGGGGSSGSWD